VEQLLLFLLTQTIAITCMSIYSTCLGAHVYNNDNMFIDMQHINVKLATLVHRSFHNAGPQYLSSLLHPHKQSRQLRSASLLSQPRINITLGSRDFRHAGPSLWNSLPHHLRSTDSYTVFKSNIKTHLFSGASISGS